MCHFAFILERQRPACWNVQHLGDAWMQTLPSDELNLNRLRKGYTTRTIRDIDKTASLKPLHSINRGFFCTSKVLRNKRSARDACAQTSHTHVTSNVTPKASKIDSREQWQNVSTTMSTIRLTTMRAFFSSIMWGGKWQPPGKCSMCWHQWADTSFILQHCKCNKFKMRFQSSFSPFDTFKYLRIPVTQYKPFKQQVSLLSIDQVRLPKTLDTSTLSGIQMTHTRVKCE